MKRKRISFFVPFVGNGELTPYNNRSDSWVLNQLDSGKVSPAIDVKHDKKNDGFIRFSALSKRVASNLVSDVLAESGERITIFRKAVSLSSDNSTSYCFRLSWRLHGSWNGSTIDELLMLSELLTTKSGADMVKLSSENDVEFDDCSAVRLDFENGCLFQACKVTFKANVVADGERLNSILSDAGFSFDVLS